ncbi:MAG: tetratricopeptide repeat protein [Candidatus Wallbacteria bacterium]|nr:tetratricopeptide repeat protein [Candidatus Wallbacteria bacterium]
MRIFSAIFLLLILTGCGKEKQAVDLIKFADKNYPFQEEFIEIKVSDRHTLPIKSGDVEDSPFYVDAPIAYFFSRLHSNIKSYNLETGKLSTYSDQELSINNFAIGRDSIYFNDANKNKIVKLSFDLEHSKNFLGQLNEDKYHNGHCLSLTEQGIFQYNYDFPEITYYNFNGKKISSFESSTYGLSGIETFENGGILLFYPGKILLFQNDGKLANKIETSYQKYLVDPGTGIYLLSEGNLLCYDQKLKLSKKFLTRNAKISRLKRAKVPSLYYESGGKIFHLLENGQIESLAINPGEEIVDFIPTYDNHFLIQGRNSLKLYSREGRKIKNYELISQYYDLLLFKDAEGNYLMADLHTQLLKVISEATLNIVQSILDNSASFAKDSNLTFDLEGNLYFVNRYNGNIEKITPKYLNQQFTPSGQSTRLPFSKLDQLLIGPDESLYLFNKEKQMVLKYSDQGSLGFQLGNLSDNVEPRERFFRNAFSIAIDNLSQLFVLDPEALLQFNNQGDFQRKISFGRNLTAPSSAGFDQNNLLWIKESGSLLALDTVSGKFQPLFISETMEILSFSISAGMIYFLSQDNDLSLISATIEKPLSTALSVYKSHKFKEACTQFEACRKIARDNPQLAFYLANCYVQLGDYSQALRILKTERLSSMPPDLDSDWTELKNILEAIQ